MKKQEKDDVKDTAAVDEEREAVSKKLTITVLGRNQKWTFHCDKHQPLANTMCIILENRLRGKCSYVAL